MDSSIPTMWVSSAMAPTAELDARRRSSLQQAHQHVENQRDLHEVEEAAQRDQRQRRAGEMREALCDPRVHDVTRDDIDDRDLAEQRGNEYDGCEHREVFRAVEMRVPGAYEQGRVVAR